MRCCHSSSLPNPPLSLPLSLDACAGAARCGPGAQGQGKTCGAQKNSGGYGREELLVPLTARATGSCFSPDMAMATTPMRASPAAAASPMAYRLHTEPSVNTQACLSSLGARALSLPCLGQAREGCAAAQGSAGKDIPDIGSRSYLLAAARGTVAASTAP